MLIAPGGGAQPHLGPACSWHLSCLVRTVGLKGPPPYQITCLSVLCHAYAGPRCSTEDPSLQVCQMIWGHATQYQGEETGDNQMQVKMSFFFFTIYLLGCTRS